MIRRFPVSLSIALFGALLVAGCGPSEEEKAQRAETSDRVVPAATAEASSAETEDLSTETEEATTEARIEDAPAQAETLAVTAEAVGGITRATSFSREAVAAALPGFEVTETSRGSEGEPVSVLEASRNDKTALTVFEGTPGQIRLIVVTDPAAALAGGTPIGSTYADIYGDSTPACTPGNEEASGRVFCPGAGLANVRLFFTGSWDGPDGTVPPNDVLAAWTASAIIWTAP